MHPPNYSAWASMEALSSHEIACLCVGIDPPSRETPPSIPSEAETDTTQEEISSIYRQIKLILERATEEKALASTASGRIKPILAIEFLNSLATSSALENLFSGNEFLCSIQKVPTPSNAPSDAHEELLSKISQLECEIAQLKKRHGYGTPMLDAVFNVIDNLYVDKTSYPKQEAVFQFLNEHPPIDGTTWSENKMKAIWAVASHPSQATGGQKPRSRRAKG